nr:nucleoside deaminase [Glycomyces tenuis]
MDEVHLARCVALARAAADAGDGAFGSILVDSAGQVLAEDLNRETTAGDPTAHPELALVRWAIASLEPDARAASTVYTSGEHCPMCAAAHAWAGLGRIVYAASSAQLAQWRAGWGLPSAPVRPLSINEVAPGITAVGPVPPFDDQMREVHANALPK